MESCAAELKRPPTFSGRRASQDAAELAAFIALLQDEGVRSYGEIGARDGDTFVDVMRALPKGAKGVALDLPAGAWGHYASRHRLEVAVAHLREQDRDASCIFGDSKSAGVRASFEARGPYDAILIDGDHRLDGVTADWQWCRLLAPIVAFHDINAVGQKSSQGQPVDVPQLWQTIKGTHRRAIELITPGSVMGIGVVWTR